MHIAQQRWTEESGWERVSGTLVDPQLVLVFGAVELIPRTDIFESVRAMYPKAHILLCSTAGEILGSVVTEHSVVLAAIHFEKTTLEFAVADIDQSQGSMATGVILAQTLPKEDLVHVMVFSDGLHINGTDLVAGLVDHLPETVAVTGGLVGGGNEFKHTYLGLDGVPEEGKVVAIGFYGKSLRIRYGAVGGWDVFGPKRIITRSEKNTLYELDGQPALELYKKYLGDKSSELPGSGLLFPLSLDLKTGEDDATGVVRTILAVNEADQSITFAGDMPQGVSTQLMKANFDRLVGGAADAADMTMTENQTPPSLAILISCIGRKLVLKERIEEETEAVQASLGSSVAMIGFYSYGEISPFAAKEKQCRLHNQTMTITTFYEE